MVFLSCLSAFLVGAKMVGIAHYGWFHAFAPLLAGAVIYLSLVFLLALLKALR